MSLRLTPNTRSTDEKQEYTASATASCQKSLRSKTQWSTGIGSHWNSPQQKQYLAQLPDAELISHAERQNMLPPAGGYHRVAMSPLRFRLIFWLRSKCNGDPWHQVNVTECSIAWCRHTIKSVSVKELVWYISAGECCFQLFFLPPRQKTILPNVPKWLGAPPNNRHTFCNTVKHC